MTRTTTHYTTTFKATHYPSRQQLHSTFGGEIISSDYNTEYGHKPTARSSIAERIAKSQRFDSQCMRSAELRGGKK